MKCPVYRYYNISEIIYMLPAMVYRLSITAKLLPISDSLKITSKSFVKSGFRKVLKYFAGKFKPLTL